MVTFSPLKQALIKKMGEEIKDQGYSLLKAGRRGGKTSMIPAIFHVTDCKVVSLVTPFGTVHPPALGLIQALKDAKIPIIQHNRLPYENDSYLHGKILTVFDDVFHIDGSYDAYMYARKRGSTLAVGSSGPEYDKDMRWQLEQGHSFATWDLMPEDVSLQKLLGDHNDASDIIHEYGAF